MKELKGAFGDIEIPLGTGEDRALLEAMVDAEPNALGASFRDRLYRQTRGHALFTVELLQRMRDERVLERDAEGRWIQVREWPEDFLPTRVQALVADRVERVPAALRRMLTVAAVEGELFTLEAVAEVLGLDPSGLFADTVGELERTHRLVEAYGVSRHRNGLRSVYRFRHVLFQKYIYDQLDSAERAHLHELVGGAVRKLAGDEVGELAPTLARHFREAGLLAEAVKYLGLAADAAKAGSAFVESVRQLQEARRLLEAVPSSPERDRLELDVLSRFTLIWLGDLVEGDEFERILTRTIELAARPGREEQLFWALGGRFAQYFFRGEHEASRRVLDDVEALLRTWGNPLRQAEFHSWAALNALNLGRPRETVRHVGQFTARYDPSWRAPDESFWFREPVPVYRALAAIAHAHLGFPARAARSLARAWNELGESPDVTVRLHLHCYAALVDWACRDPEAAEANAEGMSRRATEMGLDAWAAFAQVIHGWCASERGRLNESEERLRTSTALLDAHQWSIWRPFIDATLADVLARSGQAEEALDLVERSLEAIARTGERTHEAEVNRFRGEVLLRLPAPDESRAEEAFRSAVAVARVQKARLFELRAANSLARLLRRQGRNEEAGGSLREIHAWFTEGSRLPDLEEAAGLLRTTTGPTPVTPSSPRAPTPAGPGARGA